MNTVPGDCSTVFRRVLTASFVFFHIGLLYSPGTEEPTNSKADPQTEAPPQHPEERTPE